MVTGQQQQQQQGQGQQTVQPGVYTARNEFELRESVKLGRLQGFDVSWRKQGDGTWKVIWSQPKSQKGSFRPQPMDQATFKEFHRVMSRESAFKMHELDNAKIGHFYNKKEQAYDVSKALEANGYKTEIKKQADGTYNLKVKNATTNEYVYIDQKELNSLIIKDSGVAEKAKAEKGTNLGITNRHYVQSIKGAMETKGYNVEGKMNSDGTYNIIFTNRNTGMAEYVSPETITKVLKEAGYRQQAGGDKVGDAGLRTAGKVAGKITPQFVKDIGSNVSDLTPDFVKKGIGGVGKAIHAITPNEAATKAYVKETGKELKKGAGFAMEQMGSTGKQMVSSEIQGTLTTMANRMQKNPPAKRMLRNIPSAKGRHPMIASGFGSDGETKATPKIQASFDPSGVLGKKIDTSGLYDGSILGGKKKNVEPEQSDEQ